MKTIKVLSTSFQLCVLLTLFWCLWDSSVALGQNSPGISSGGVVNFDSSILVDSMQTVGEYDNTGLSTWNGAPLSPSNEPTPEQDQLSASWNFYVDPAAVNKLFITVGNVTDTEYGYINGSPFVYVALTGLSFTLAPNGNPQLATAIYSGNYALAGENLVGNSIGSYSPGPLTVTPGWQMSSSAFGSSIQFNFNASSVGYAFSHFSSVTGSSRINGGGVFDLTFDSSVDLLTDVNWSDLSGNASNGSEMYTEQGTVTTPTPEPCTSSIIFMIGILSTCLYLKHRRPGSCVQHIPQINLRCRL